ncbi:helix-turn-helix domain-containing protein [Thermoactinospora rubra]|uniref:helix-turn-helix domain-containing protein n=1 Tax=Thermoactinospora rubra TaxID=1088767 RepID=UPI001301CEA5|nr:helix-turn-helix transcriptional regulator [Thermoactinospora rubra]
MSRDRARAAQFVIARRGELGLTQQQLAARAGVDVKTIYNLESGERWPQAATRGKIEKALGWVGGALEDIAAGRASGFQFPTAAELIADGLERRHLTEREATEIAGVTEEEWRDVASGSPSIEAARAEDPSRANVVARVALTAGVIPEQLAEAGHERAAAVLRELIRRAARISEPEVKAVDPYMRRLLELWPQTVEWQRRAVVRLLEDMISESPAAPVVEQPYQETRETG